MRMSQAMGWLARRRPQGRRAAMVGLRTVHQRAGQQPLPFLKVLDLSS